MSTQAAINADPRINSAYHCGHSSNFPSLKHNYSLSNSPHFGKHSTPGTSSISLIKLRTKSLEPIFKSSKLTAIATIHCSNLHLNLFAVTFKKYD